MDNDASNRRMLLKWNRAAQPLLSAGRCELSRFPVRAILVLTLFILSQLCINAQEVSWLSDVQQPPKHPSSFDVGHRDPLLAKSDGTLITNVAEWLMRRNEIDAKWQQFLGRNLVSPKTTDFSVVESRADGEVTRSLIRYECEPGLFVEAYRLSLTAKPSQRQPGIVALHHTAKNTIDEIAGVSGPDSRKLGLKLAKRGFVVICPRCFLWQDGEKYDLAVEKFRERHPKSLGMRKMLFDAQRAVDLLAAMPDVDPERIGAIGHSLGAKETLYLTAFDARIRAAVASEGGTALKSTNWDAPWYLGPQINEPDFRRNHHELLALIAPRAFLIVGGESGPGAADGDRSWPLLSDAMPVYRLFGSPPRLGLLNHHQGHDIPDETFERMADWLDQYLNKSSRISDSP